MDYFCPDYLFSILVFHTESNTDFFGIKTNGQISWILVAEINNIIANEEFRAAELIA